MSGKVLLGGAALIAILLSFVLYQHAHAPVHEREIVLLRAPDGRTVQLSVEIADDDPERARGLMERAHLPAGGGMLFVFDEASVRSFWMKHTLIPLDILFFDADGLFVSRAAMEPCTADPCALYPSAAPARYALEVNRGEPLTAAVGTGWTIERSFKE